MTIAIQNMTVDTADIIQLYPAAIVKTGVGDETTQVSLEWLEIESRGRVELESFGIFVHLKDGEKHSFLFKSKEEMDDEVARIASQFKC